MREKIKQSYKFLLLKIKALNKKNEIESSEIMKQEMRINIYGKDKEDILQKMLKINFLITNFVSSSKNDFKVTILFSIFLLLYLFNLFFGVFINIHGVYSNKYLGDNFTKTGYVYKKHNSGFIKNDLDRVLIKSCGEFYCIYEGNVNKESIIEKPLIKQFVIFEY